MGFLDDFRVGYEAGARARTLAQERRAAQGDLPPAQPYGDPSSARPFAAIGPAQVDNDDELTECKEVIAGFLEQTQSLKRQLAEAWAARAAMEAIIKFPGAGDALLKALHPDTGQGGDVASRTAIFETLMRVLQSLGVLDARGKRVR